MQISKKGINIILIAALVMVIATVAIILIMKNTPNTTANTEGTIITQKETVLREEENMDKLKNFLFKGKRFTATSSSANQPACFEFREDGTFKGYTKAEPDDLGTWEIKTNEVGSRLVISTLSITEEYKIDFNNNNDITLTNEDNQTYVLAEEETINVAKETQAD